MDFDEILISLHHLVSISILSIMSSIAVFGLGGFLGNPVLESLQQAPFADKVKFPILAVTRDTSKYTSTDKVKYIEGDVVNDRDAVIKELQGVDVIVELVGPDPSVFAATEKVAAAVKPKLYIPSQFGVDIAQSQSTLPGFLGLKTDHSTKLRDAGLKVVDIVTGLFGDKDSFVTHTSAIVGVDESAKKVTYLGSPKNHFSYTILSDIGKTVAAAAVSPNPSELPDLLRVNSGTISQEELVAKFEAAKSVKLGVKEVSAEEALAEAKKVWAEGFNGNKFLYYLQVLISQGKEKGLWFGDNDNDVVNPSGSAWKWTTV